MIPPHFRMRFAPDADLAAVVVAEGARFTVLTSRLIRMEFSRGGNFEDRATQTFWYRRQPVPQFSVRRNGALVEIITEHLHLRYLSSAAGFTKDTLWVEIEATGATWRFGDRDPDNLMGTARTLDQANGRVRLQPGLMSKSGWAVVDDSASLVFDADSWLEPRPAGATDIYLFGYGHDYRGCLADFSKVAGTTPMIPRWILGNWWSRYWAYTQAELRDLVEDFRRHAVPLGVCIIDMDWHITATGNASTGWTGFTWNRELWPDPYAFMAWLHSQGVRTAMNLHPAEGVWPHEEQYAAVARAAGIDPASGRPVPFDIANPTFTNAYFDIILHPMEEKGVDFWWMDWQQGTQSGMAGLDPLWWLNHLHFFDRGRDGKKRPFIFSRWAGISSHRYPIGFSGDTVVSWDSLIFQPYFTATAANAGYGWWSHDIGGHMRGVEDPELYARWVQLGVFSPILRLHSTNNPYHDRRPWAHAAAVLEVVRDAMQLRHALVPYVYSMAWRDHCDSIPLVSPMYHVHPEKSEAYCCPNQYYFGSELVVAPFVQPANADTGLSRQVVWLPEGDWFDFFSGEYYEGGKWCAIYGGLKDMPVFAKAGAIVPLGRRQPWGGLENPTELDVHVFAGADGAFNLYEDDGDSTAYLDGAHATTRFEQSWRGDRMVLTIHPVRGQARLVPSRRDYRLIFSGVRKLDEIEITVNGTPVQLESSYNGLAETVTCRGLQLTPADRAVATLSVRSGSLLSRRDRTEEKIAAMLPGFRLESRAKQGIDAQLPAIVADANLLGNYWMDLKDAQAIALAEIIHKRASDREA